MDKWFKNTKTVGSMISLMLLLSLFMLIPQLAVSATAEAEILIFSLSTEKVKE